MARLLSVALLSLSVVLAAAAASPSSSSSSSPVSSPVSSAYFHPAAVMDQHHHRRMPFCISRGGESTASTTGSSTTTSTVMAIPAGGASSSSSSSSSSYAAQLEAVKASVLEAAAESIEQLRRSIITESAIVEDFGTKADTICNQALEAFVKTAPTPADGNNGEEDSSDSSSSSSSSSSVYYDRTLESLEAALDAPLQVLYLKQLALLREQALQRYRAATKTSTSGTSEYEAMLQADARFVREAEAATRAEGGSSNWDYSSERTYLQSVMNSIAESGKKALDVQLKSAQQQQTAMQFLQQQQQMIQQLQMQLYGQTSPWNIGVAYRIPDTNFNLQGSYQQGKANLQLSCVPDEYAPFLGPNGFTNGVGPGNLGLSLNLSV